MLKFCLFVNICFLFDGKICFTMRENKLFFSFCFFSEKNDKTKEEESSEL